MQLIPPRLLLKVEHYCPYVQGSFDGKFPHLGDKGKIDNLASMNPPSTVGSKNFAVLRTGWKTEGLFFHLEVSGKAKDPEGSRDKPLQSDGLTLLIDTHSSRSSHRATAFCHMFHFLAAGGGHDGTDACVIQGQIRRAMDNAPSALAGSLAFRSRRFRGGYEIEGFLSADALHGFDPQTNRELGFFYRILDRELGEQTLLPGVDEAPLDDPSLWETLKLVDDGFSWFNFS